METSESPVRTGEESLFRKQLAMSAAWLLPVCSVLMLPGALIFSINWNVHLFSTGSVTLLAAGFLCFFPERLASAFRSLPRILTAAWAGILVIALYQIFRHGSSYRFTDIGFSLLYAVVPLFGYVFRKELLRTIPPLSAVFWLWNLIYCIILRCTGSPAGGIPSNINWSAAFTFLTGVCAVYFVSSRIPHKTGKYALISLVGAGTLWILLDTMSRGVFAGILAALLVFGYTRLRSPAIRKAVRIAALACFALGFCTLFVLLGKPEFQKQFRTSSDRGYFALTTPDMIMAAPLAGHGLPSFEAEYLNFRDAEFFRLPHCSVRVDHPHNDLLFAAAGMGLAGLLCWLFLLLTPLFRFLRNYDTISDPLVKLLFFLFLVLLVHAQLDLIFFHIPLAFLALIIPGILCGEVFPPAEAETAVPVPSAFRIAGGILTAMALFAVLTEFCSTQLIWQTKRNPAPDKIAETVRKVLAVPQVSPDALYKLLFLDNMWTEQHPEEALRITGAIARTSTPDYAHVNFLRARASEHLQKFPEAEQYYLAENKSYPLQILHLFFLRNMYAQLGETEKFRFTDRCLKDRMHLRGLGLRELQIILQNPHYDLRPWEIPPQE